MHMTAAPEIPLKPAVCLPEGIDRIDCRCEAGFFCLFRRFLEN